MMRANSIRFINYLFVAVGLIAYFVATGWDNLFAAVFSFVFILSPLAINAIVAFFAKTRASQITLLCTAIAYAAWVCFFYIHVMYPDSSSPDGQGGFAILLTAALASPVLLIAWIACLTTEIIQRRKVA